MLNSISSLNQISSNTSYPIFHTANDALAANVQPLASSQNIESNLNYNLEQQLQYDRLGTQLDHNIANNPNMITPIKIFQRQADESNNYYLNSGKQVSPAQMPKSLLLLQSRDSAQLQQLSLNDKETLFMLQSGHSRADANVQASLSSSQDCDFGQG